MNAPPDAPPDPNPSPAAPGAGAAAAASRGPARRFRGHSRGWEVVVVVIAVLIAAPVGVVLASVFTPAGDVWSHLASTVLPDYLRNSLILMVGVGVGTIVIGVSTAWLVTMCSFPGRRIFEWALLLPMAIPAYILAYAYTDFLQFTGPVQTWIRTATGLGYGDYWFPAIRSVGGAVAMLTLALYPYVYLLTRAAFLEQPISILEAARSLGRSAWATFATVSLPLARPAIAAGAALALMETLADFGTVKYFGVVTFTTGIYRTWFGLGERVASAQLAAMLLGFVLLLIVLERSLGRRPQGTPLTSRYRALARFRLSGARAWGALLGCTLPVVLGFLLPAGVLGRLALESRQAFDPDFWRYAGNTVTVAGLTAFITLSAALLLAYGRRLRPSRLVRACVRVAAMGYAVPGSVIAVGVLLHLGWLDNRIDLWMRSLFGLSTGLLLSGTIAGLLFAYVVRFLAVAYGAVEASLSKITSSMDDAARSLGRRGLRALLDVHVPLLRGTLLSASLLVFVDVVKELPATLIVRPFNFDTMAVRVYRLASDERLAEAAAGSLAIAAIGLVPVIALSWGIARSRELRPRTPRGGAAAARDS